MTWQLLAPEYSGASVELFAYKDALICIWMHWIGIWYDSAVSAPEYSGASVELFVYRDALICILGHIDCTLRWSI